MKPLFVFATLLDILAIAACVGLLVCYGWVIFRPDVHRLLPNLWAWFGGAVVLLSASSFLILISRTLELSRAPIADLMQFLPVVVEKTDFGRIWQVRILALVVLWVAWYVGRLRMDRGLSVPVSAVMLAVIAFTRSTTGHAGDHGHFALAAWVDWLHVLSSGIWVGGIFVWAFIIFPMLLKCQHLNRSVATDTFGRFSSVAATGLTVIVLTGIYQAWEGLGKADALWQSAFGQILLVKLALIVCLVYLGAYNRYTNLPTLDIWSGRKRAPHPFSRLPGFRMRNFPNMDDAGNLPLRYCARTVTIQSALGAAIFIVSAILHHAMPPTDIRNLVLSQTNLHIVHDRILTINTINAQLFKNNVTIHQG
ncbi:MULTISPECIES: copper resistance D family protein [Acidithiobacillus]|jgi:putative copper resistance protein D|uniref:Copper resistance protein, putative n=2 Tax=Acidithiobacillus ferrooxidans TaxID=920 RepID=B7J7W5_ACIF2|nr:MULTISPECIES: CopD family protein [Acidithiobacillus]EGQ61057.1 copper resistance protein, putative [Acidithiobacillus sp. GGI-221]MDA8376128.1 CopD family protein [Planctomycetia bacterium]ACK80319.1 copper resistance protein, putative [Acidithiobacillus ferrooxidans ATCC 23270]MBN6745110.1 CopD family protein [Acidithiobacillus sp. MC2.2]MBN6746941.1 CopD family protein [Acidithiobacillus sp. PG05]